MLPYSSPIITITTDFGQADGYVGAMKGVLLGICPRATLVDLSHLVPPQDVMAGAMVLRQAARYYAPETIHLAVVDPGVGTDRRLLAVACSRGIFVGPDNGLFAGLCPPDSEAFRAVHLNRPEFWRAEVSETFHGRDILAPIAAYLAAGLTLPDVGEPVEPAGLFRLAWPAPRIERDTVHGEIIYVDHFGNLITNIEATLLIAESNVCVRLGERTIGPLCKTYGSAPTRTALALVGSSGLLEIAVVNGSAAGSLGAGHGSPVTVLLGAG